MKKYPKIGQFKDLIRALKFKYEVDKMPTLSFKGTVKLHGANAAIVKYPDKIEYQSRSRVLSIGDDNKGFMGSMSKLDLSFLFDRFSFKDYIAIYGEWCGEGIQPKVATNELPKMFVIFGILIDDKWVDIPQDLFNHKLRIYNVNQFNSYEVTIDFNNPYETVDALIKLTAKVEECCPVAHQLGIVGMGEGIVFTCVEDATLKFKSKGSKHSNTKVTTFNMVDVEKFKEVGQLASNLAGEARLNQGLDYLKEHNIPVNITSTKAFIDWIISDVFSEEQHTITLSKLTHKEVSSEIAARARVWFKNQLSDVK